MRFFGLASHSAGLGAFEDDSITSSTPFVRGFASDEVQCIRFIPLTSSLSVTGAVGLCCVPWATAFFVASAVHCFRAGEDSTTSDTSNRRASVGRPMRKIQLSLAKALM